MKPILHTTTVLALAGMALTLIPEAVMAQSDDAPDWLHFDIESVRADREAHGRPWQEIMRVPDLFAGLYEIPAGGEDRQSPHDADEVYYVVAGRATAVVEGDRVAVGPGSILFVAKDRDHRFVDITEDLSILVFFATAGSGGDG
jgi:mannose-6-phosphate isomerase-like protein (cupin superfamily)